MWWRPDPIYGEFCHSTSLRVNEKPWKNRQNPRLNRKWIVLIKSITCFPAHLCCVQAGASKVTENKTTFFCNTTTKMAAVVGVLRGGRKAFTTFIIRPNTTNQYENINLLTLWYFSNKMEQISPIHFLYFQRNDGHLKCHHGNWSSWYLHQEILKIEIAAI